jgi:hypothetical protein
LLSNLRGFAYRHRDDHSWTMEWMSDAFRTITGYDPHRFLQDESLSFASLILPEHRPAASAQIRNALQGRYCTTVRYRIMTAHRSLVTVEDRLAGVYDASGAIIAVEGIIDYATTNSCPPSSLTQSNVAREPRSIATHESSSLLLLSSQK